MNRKVRNWFRQEQGIDVSRRTAYSVGGRDLSHETHGTETVESHQEPEVGLEEYANERHEPTVNETEEYGSNKKATNKKKNNNEGQD